IPRNQGRQTRSRTRKAAPSQPAASQDVIDLDASDADGRDGTYAPEPEPEPEPEDGLVPCPVCGARMKEEAVYSHLDTCDGTPKSRAQPSSRKGSATPITSRNRLSPKPSDPQRQHIGQLNYALLKEGPLRKKLQELGVPAWGSKELMIRRHTEWVNLWNSSCDSSRPRSKRELLHDLDIWERSQGGSARDAGGSGVMKKDFDGDGWATKHRDQFADLLANARKKRSTPTGTDENDKEAASQSEHPVSTPNDDQQGGQTMPTAHMRNTTLEATARDLDRIAAEPLYGMAAPKTSSQRTADDAEMQDMVPSNQPNGNVSEGQPASPMQAQVLSHNNPSSLPSHLASPTTRRKPMFEVPADPIVDMDGDGIH
ncbi:hypothetical protein LTS18_010232, partial [Coniosporium uncinatum]